MLDTFHVEFVGVIDCLLSYIMVFYIIFVGIQFGNC